MDLEELKEQYNKKLARMKKAEEYFKTHTVSECIKYLDLFNSVTSDLGSLMKDYKALTGKEMSKEQKINGFREE
ncbi:MAG: hypothetical protein ACI4WU_04895 [Bacilli bacterium]